MDDNVGGAHDYMEMYTWIEDHLIGRWCKEPPQQGTLLFASFTKKVPKTWKTRNKKENSRDLDSFCLRSMVQEHQGKEEHYGGNI